MTEREGHISPESSASHRPASVNLRTEAAPHQRSGLDAAHQSLADALKLVFRGLMAAMVILLVVFALSGVQQVKEGETGIKLLFGRKVADDLKPGPQFAAPFPFGELIKVVSAGPTTDLNESFWPNLPPEQRDQPVEKLAAMGKPTLKPGEDGSNITADQNIALTKWQVQYKRASALKFSQNIYSEDEARIVQGAVERGVVHAMAETTIDDLLKQSSSDQASVARRAQAVAQAMLNQIESGLEITQLTLKEKSPPFPVFASFTGVQSAEQKAGERRSYAESEARNKLNAAAGGANEALIALIDSYERAIAKGDKAEQTKILDAIHGAFDGKEAAGLVTAVLNEARQYRSTIVNQRKAELAMFQAKQAQFKINPDLVVQRDWADAMSALLKRDIVEVFWTPPGMDRAEIWLNRDINRQKAFEAEQKRKQIQATQERQRLDAEKEQLKTRTDAVEMSLEPDLRKR